MKLEYKDKKNLGITVEMEESDSESGFQPSIEAAIKYLDHTFNNKFLEIFNGLKIVIADNKIKSGAKTYAEELLIILDKSKNSLSVKSAEEILISAEILSPGDWTRLVPDPQDKYSCITIQFIHEVGHVADYLAGGDRVYKRLDKKHSPTKYGQISDTECFAEAFMYYVFGKLIDKTAQEEVKKVVEKINQY